MEQQIMFSRLVVLVAAGVSLAAAADVRVVEEIAVKCNGDIITRGELEEQRRELELYLRQEQHLSGPQLQTAVEEQSKDMLREKIDELLLVQKAKDLNISVESDVNRRLGQMQVQSKITDPDKFHDYIREQSGIPFEDFRQKLVNSFLTNRVIGQEVGSHVVIPEPELRQYYEQHKAEYMRQEQVFLSQIFISTEGKTPEQIAAAEAKAKDLVARARKGEKFATWLRPIPTNGNGAQRRATATWGRGMSLKEIDDFAFKQKKGSVTDPIPTKNPAGFAIVRIDERFEAGQAPFEDVKEQIQDKMAGAEDGAQGAGVSDQAPPAGVSGSERRLRGYWRRSGKRHALARCGTVEAADTTKEEVLAHKKRKKFLGVIPHGGRTKADEIDTSTLGAPKDPAAAPAAAKDPTTSPGDCADQTMKSPYASDVEPNKLLTTSFLVHAKEIRQKKSGEFYLSLLLGDRTGELDAKMWDNVAEVMDDFDRDDFVLVKGIIQIFHNRPQLTIHKVRRMDDSEIDFSDYFPSSKREPDAMWNELRGIVARSATRI